MTVRDYFIECLGTFVLVLMGTLALAQYGTGSPAATLAVAVAFGLGLAAGFSVIGPERFRWINPALTLAAALDGRLGPAESIGSILAQVVGAVAAAFVLWGILGADAVSFAVTTAPDVVPALISEFVLSAVFVLVYLHSTDDFSNLAAARVAMVLTFTGIHLVAMPISDASINPARSIGPALVALDFTHLWLYVLTPLAGAAAAVAVFRVAAER